MRCKVDKNDGVYEAQTEEREREKQRQSQDESK